MDAQRDAPERPDDRGERQRGDRERHDVVDRRNEFESGAGACVEHERGRAGAQNGGTLTATRSAARNSSQAMTWGRGEATSAKIPRNSSSRSGKRLESACPVSTSLRRM